jgi:uncharacterized protein YlxP (DUF503 family)
MSAIVGLLTLSLHVIDAVTLKDKRQVIKSLIGRIEHRYNVSVAEVGDLGSRSDAEVAVAFVANEEAHVHRVLNEVARFIEADSRADVGTVEIEVL